MRTNLLAERATDIHFSVIKLKQPFAIRVLTWFAALASAGMYLSILLAILDIGPHIMGGERVTRIEWLHIAAPLVAAIGIDGVDLLRPRFSQAMVTPSRNCDFHFDYRLRLNSWRA